MSEQLTEAHEFLEKLRELSREAPGKVGLSIQSAEAPIVHFAGTDMRLRSTAKTAIALAYAHEVAKDPSFASKTVDIAEVHKVNPGYYDGGAHEAWTNQHAASPHVTHEQIAQGMMHHSSNTCTQYMLDVIGHEKVNRIMADHKLDLPEFSAKYDELHAPLKGSAHEMVKLVDVVAHKEPPAVREAFKSVTHPLHVISAEHGEAHGFGKGGSGIRALLGSAGQKHDLNIVWHTEHNGKPLSACLLLNDMKPAASGFMHQRLGSFMCEASCNTGFRARCAEVLGHMVPMVEHAMSHIKSGHLHR